MLVPDVMDAESGMFDAIWALASMARNRVKGSWKKLIMFDGGKIGD